MIKTSGTTKTPQDKHLWTHWELNPTPLALILLTLHAERDKPITP
jgi:hypothetical protein